MPWFLPFRFVIPTSYHIGFMVTIFWGILLSSFSIKLTLQYKLSIYSVSNRFHPSSIRFLTLYLFIWSYFHIYLWHFFVKSYFCTSMFFRNIHYDFFLKFLIIAGINLISIGIFYFCPAVFWFCFFVSIIFYLIGLKITDQ